MSMKIKDFKPDQVIEFRNLVGRITGTVLGVTETHLDVGSDYGVHKVVIGDEPIFLASCIETYKNQ